MANEELKIPARDNPLSVSDVVQAAYGGDGKRVISLKRGNKEGNESYQGLIT
jgi:hypothetical protein